MKCNMGKRDRWIRLVLGLVFVALGLFYKTWLYIPAAVLLLTSLTGRCPAYVPLKFDTLQKSK